MLRCLGNDCEGWELSAEDRFCPNCGHWQYPLMLTCFQAGVATQVLAPGRAGLRLDYLGRAAALPLTGLELPAWLRAESVAAQLEPGQSLEIPLEVLATAAEGLPGQIRLQQAELEIWSSPPAQAELSWDQALLNPEQAEMGGWLRVTGGALSVSELPAGWSCSEPLPLVLSQRSRPLLALRAPAVEGLVRWQLGHTLVEGQLHCEWAGQLEVPDRLEWCLTSSSELQVELHSRQGAVEIEKVESPLTGLRCEVPQRVEGAGLIKLSLDAEAPLGLSWFEVVLRDGRRRRVLLDLVRPDRTEFPGWLLLDLGSTTSTAALVDEEGRLSQLCLEGDSQVLPSGLAYFADGPPIPTDVAGPNVVLQAKRHLGLAGFAFRLILPTQEILQRTPEQVLADHVAVLLERVGRAPQLARHSLRRCCLAHPAAFSPRQVQLLRQAFLSRLDCQLVLISEPLAAAYDFLSRRLWPQREWRLLLYDFGGTTSDVALLKVDSRRATMVTAALEHVGGDRWFGGNDITRALADLLEGEQKPEAEQLKRAYSLGEPGPLARSEVDKVVEPNLRLSLPEPPVKPDLIVLSGLGSLYPLIAEWLQKHFPGVPLERAVEPKLCVVLGARYHPEVVRFGPPRSLAPGSTWLAFPEETGATVCTTRLGVKLMGEKGARFHPLVAVGQPLPCLAELTPLSLLPGRNQLEVVENLGWEEDYLLPDGTTNPQLISLERIHLNLSEPLDPAQTVLRWALSADYRLLVRVESVGRILLEVGPFTLWPE